MGRDTKLLFVFLEKECGQWLWKKQCAGVSTVCDHNVLLHKILMETMTSRSIGEEKVILPPIIKTLCENKNPNYQNSYGDKSSRNFLIFLF